MTPDGAVLVDGSGSWLVVTEMVAPAVGWLPIVMLCNVMFNRAFAATVPDCTVITMLLNPAASAVAVAPPLREMDGVTWVAKKLGG